MKHKNLFSERVRIGMTQAELAEYLGTTTRSLSAYENNDKPLPSELVQKSADLFKCSTDYLLDRTEERLPRSVA